MRTFLSWSGDQSRAFAEEFKPWFEQVLSHTDVWLSTEDIDKGSIWFSEIIGELNNCNSGIICVTRENMLAPWIHFEAGGMIKGLGKSRVATILLDVDISELRQPLNLFNGLRLNRQGAWQLVKSFNRISDRPIKDHVVVRTFDKFWPDLDQTYRLLFPQAHKAAEKAEPVHMAPDPATSIFGGRSPEKRRRRKSETAAEESDQQRLFNGGKD